MKTNKKKCRFQEFGFSPKGTTIEADEKMICKDCKKYAWCGYRNKYPDALITSCSEFEEAETWYINVWCKDCNQECMKKNVPQKRPIKCTRYKGVYQASLF